MEKLLKLYEEIEDLEIIISEHSQLKHKIKNLENEIKNYTSHINLASENSLKIKREDLENQFSRVQEEIKKINLYTKECYSVAEMRLVLDFITDQDVLIEKSSSFLRSLLYTLYLTKSDIDLIFNPTSYINKNTDEGMYKVLKMNKEINEFFNVVIVNQPVYNYCLNELNKILSSELNSIIPTDLLLYVDDLHMYLIFKTDTIIEEPDKLFLRNATYVNFKLIENYVNLSDVVYNILKNNLSTQLIKRNLEDAEIEKSNNIFYNTEFYINNLQEWKIDSVMKRIIYICKKKRSGKFINIKDSSLYKKILNKYKLEDKSTYSRFYHAPSRNEESKDQSIQQKDGSHNLNKPIIYETIQKFNKKSNYLFKHISNSELLPENISQEYFDILLCLDIYNKSFSDRIDKANRMVERSINKFFTVDSSSYNFILFADVAHFIRTFENLDINEKLSEFRENVYFTLIKKSSEIKMSINEPAMLLKVYFKDMYLGFMDNLKKFVPQKSKISFEIHFFDSLYKQFMELILNLHYLELYQIKELLQIIDYIINMSFHIQKGLISELQRLSEYRTVFNSSIEELSKLYYCNKLNLSKDELRILVSLLYRDSKGRRDFLTNLL